MSELRWHPILEEWVISATHRQDRTFLPPHDYCPICPTKPGAFPTDMDLPGMRNLVDVWTDRSKDLGGKDFINYVLIFENKGKDIGLTLCRGCRHASGRKARPEAYRTLYPAAASPDGLLARDRCGNTL